MRKSTKGRWKHGIDTQWEEKPTRERMAAARKRTLRSATVRSARSVWSECRSRVIESRKFAGRLGLPICVKGGSTEAHKVRRREKAQAKCVEAGPGAESRAKAYGGILGSWERPHRPMEDSRKRSRPANQRPGAGREIPAAHASETRGTAMGTASEGDRSGREDRCGSRSGLVVAFESRRTKTVRSL